MDKKQKKAPKTKLFSRKIIGNNKSKAETKKISSRNLIVKDLNFTLVAEENEE